MPFTLLNTDWNELGSVVVAGHSSNPVFQLIGKNGTSILWLKYAAGIGRVAFADEVMRRTGVVPPGGRQIPSTSTEAQTIMAALTRVANTITDANVKKLVENKIVWAKGRAAQPGVDLYLMEPLQGKTLEMEMAARPSRQDRELYLLGLLQVPACRQDLARMIAADLLLGNFDRLGVCQNQDGSLSTTANTRNFMFDPAAVRFLPIDNDTVSPGPEAFKGTPPSSEEVYELVLKGGFLDNLVDGTFPSKEQHSLGVLLGPQGPAAIAQVLNQMTRAAGEPQTGPSDALIAAAQQLSAEVATAVRALLVELKHPGGSRLGLKVLMRAQSEVQGMCYSTFKVKCRFADLLLNYNPGSEEAMKKALIYGKYRDWKSELGNLLGAVKQYIIPQQIPRGQTKSEKAGRAVTQAVGSVAGILPVGKKIAGGAVETSNTRSYAHDIKEKVRKGSPSVKELRAALKQLEANPIQDRAVVKSRVLVIAQLQLSDLKRRFKFTTTVYNLLTANASDDWIGRFYSKAISKRKMDVVQMLSAFSKQVREIQGKLQELQDESGVSTELGNVLTELGIKLQALLNVSKSGV
jgi:hypothetical protein